MQVTYHFMIRLPSFRNKGADSCPPPGIDQRMKAAVYTKTKSVKVLRITDVETPISKDNEVLIKTRAASVNPLDWRLKSRRPGVDVAGEVVVTGKGVTQFKPGDAVFGTCRGAFAEYACTSEATLVLKPDNVTFEQAACVPVAGLTALQGLRDKGHLRAGQKVLINGATGGVGTFAVQIAKSVGAEVTGVCSARNVELVRSLGADHVIDYTKRDFTQSPQRYDVILDNVLNHSPKAAARLLAPHGVLIPNSIGNTGGLLAGLPRMARAALMGKGATNVKFVTLAVNRENLTALGRLLESGEVRVVIAQTYPLGQAARAVTHMLEHHASGKIAITV